MHIIPLLFPIGLANKVQYGKGSPRSPQRLLGGPSGKTVPEQKACARCSKYPTFGEVPYSFCMISGVYYVIDMSDIVRYCQISLIHILY